MGDEEEADILENLNETLEIIPFHQLKFHEKIGEGGYSNVYKGTWLGTKVALKVFKKRKSAYLAQKFKSEATIISKLRHPNIVLFLGASLFSEKYVLATEYIQSGSLFNWLHVKENRLNEA